MVKNPLLQKKYEEGFTAGYAKGEENGIRKSTAFFAKKFEGLSNVPGIGEKTFQKIKNQLGEQYFE